MSLHLRPTLAVLAMVILNLGIRDTCGFWSPAAFASTMLALSLAIAACVLPERLIHHPIRNGNIDPTGALMAGVAVTLVAINVNSTETSYADVVWARKWLVWVALIGFLVLILFLLRFRGGFLPLDLDSSRRRLLIGFVVVTFGLGLVFRGLVLTASPDPVIDVYSWLRDYADHFLEGRNPYENDIQSPYQTERALASKVYDPRDPRPAAYPPHPFLLAAPFRALGFDVRWANVVGDWLGTLALFGVAWRRGRPVLGYLAAAAWLFCPRIAFMMEQAWYEPMLAGLFGVGLWLSEMNGVKKWAGYVLLGLGLTAKQFGLPLLAPLAWTHRRHWWLLLLGLAVGGLVMLPWFLWSPDDFISIVLKKHMQRPTQFHSITIASACYQFGSLAWVPPRQVTWALAGVLIAVVSLRTPPRLAATALGLGTALCIFCVFHTQGFPNYFYLCQFLWLFGAVGLMRPVSDPGEGPPTIFGPASAP